MSQVYYSPLQEKIALLWVQVNFDDYLRKNPDISFETRKNKFGEFLEVGFSIAAELINSEL